MAQKEKKQQHLMTDKGFMFRLVINLLAMSIILLGCILIQPMQDVAVDAFYYIQARMLATANRFAWWSILGLLSSSCCAIQILLNAMSFGCAGFNTVLGPLRPTFVAFTIVAQIGSWYVAYRYINQPSYSQWTSPVAASTMLSFGLTLLPEFLAWRVNQHMQMSSKQKTIRRQEPQNSTLTLQFQLSTMGCISCVETVSRVLDGIKEVQSHRVVLEDGFAEVAMEAMEGTFAQDSIIKIDEATFESNKHHLSWMYIAEQLDAAGFPVEHVGSDL